MRRVLLACSALLGRFRAQLLFRALGACLVISSAIAYTELGVGGVSARGEWELHGLTACGLSLLLAGGRLLTLVPAALWLLMCFGIALSDTSLIFYFPAAEWTLWLALSWGSLPPAVLAGVRCARGDDGQPGSASLDRTIAAVFRTTVIVTLAMAALHKVNTDFFDPSVSCIALERRLVDWWGLPAFAIDAVGPAQIVLGEAAAALALALWPRVGMVLSLLFAAAFMSIGAPAFAAVVATMGMAAMPVSAAPFVARELRRKWRAVLVSMLLVVALSGALYRGVFPWPPIGLAHALGAFMLWVAALTLRAARPPAPGRGAEPDAPPIAAARVYIALLAGALVLNGLSPYLGLKFQYSFAMLSNLRADDDRWNSLIFPRAMRLTAHDPFVHVRRVRYVRMVGGQRFDRGGPLDPGLYSPNALRNALKATFNAGIAVTLDVEYQGERRNWLEVADPSELYTWVDSLPSRRLFQNVLDAGRPQTCVH
jgi:hypothetical protein